MKTISFKNRNTWLTTILFALFAISLLNPLGSIFSTYAFIPDNDFRSHSALIIQAKMAIEEGQFPIRIAPFQHQGFRYPEYQFYGVFPFSLAGYLYKFFSYFHSGILLNPFNTLKLILMLSIIFGGVFAYRFARLFTQSDVIAVLAATAYFFSPYLIFNMTLNGDFTEAFAQGLLPIALYYSFSILLSTNSRMKNFILSSIAWFAVLTSHLITFAYGILFFVLIAIAFFLIRLSTFKQLLYSIFSMIYAWFLAAWYIVPVLILAPYLAASGGAIGSHRGEGLGPTSIFNLFALRADSSGISFSLPSFYASIGWITLFCFITCIFFILNPTISRQSKRYYLMASTSLIFALAVFLSWSWVNIWRYLPYFFSIGQFGHRFLVQIMWIGIILFVLAVENVFGDKLDAKSLVIGIFIICFASSSWLVKPNDGIKISTLLANPEMTAGSHDYFIKPERLPFFPGLQQYGFIQIPLMTIDSKLLLNYPIHIPKNLITADTSVHLKGKMDTSKIDGDLLIKINDNVVEKIGIKKNVIVDSKIPLGKLIARNKQNDISLSFGFSPNTLLKILPITINELVFLSDKNKVVPIQKLDLIKKFCFLKNSVTTCKINFHQRTAIQLPFLYYPKLLNVTLDGVSKNYNATYYQNDTLFKKSENFDPAHDWLPYIVSTIIVSKGAHVITINNHGIEWANIISILSWGFLLLFILLGIIYKYFNTRA
jgi:hypothetical protein